MTGELISSFGVVIAIIIGVKYINAIESGSVTFIQALIKICIIGIIIFPLYFMLVSLVSKSNNIPVYMIELGIIQFSMIMLALSLLLPTVDVLGDRYL